MRALMLQGTASGVGKSVLTAGLCRLLARQGVRVAPFKPQNMSNNAAVTIDGGEIGRAQALQALACGLEPAVDMNPVLIKPEADTTAQLIVRGKAVGKLHAHRFREDRAPLLPVVLESFERLARAFDLVLVEGAGSPAEPNLRAGDIANMGFSAAADIPVWLIGDIDKGGVFAALTGTLGILSPEERRRVQAVLINKFRGHAGLLQDALDWFEQHAGIPVAGVVPHVGDLDLPDEDAPYRIAAQEERPNTALRIAVLAYPYMSNHDDLDPLAAEPGITVRLIRRPEELHGADMLILPGSKHVAADIGYVRQHGFPEAIARFLRYGGKVLGICGGLQMLGETIEDPEDVEGGGTLAGLGLPPVRTRMRPVKQLKRVSAVAQWPAAVPVWGYEIHHGETVGGEGLFPWSARSRDGQIFGTYLHGLFDSGAFRQAFFHQVFGLTTHAEDHRQRILQALDRLADTLEAAIHPRFLERLKSG